jgi:PhnB protein
MAEPSPIQGVIPYLAMGGRANEACDFYMRAFAAEDAGRMPRPDGEPGLMHAQMRINGGMLMMTDHMGPDGVASMNFGHLQLDVADGRAWWDRAIGAGCTEVLPYERQPWDDDWGLLRDPFSVSWGIMQTGSAG